MPNFKTIDQEIDRFIDDHVEEIIAVTQNLIRIPSVKGEPVDGAPYGAETRVALDYILSITQRYGFTTKMVGGYAAHAEFGEGDELIGMLAHVDVVPAGSDWIHEPFGGEVVDGKIYGRGAIDDKGPAIAGTYGLIAVKETAAPITRRLRAIYGADEESGFGCMAHYFKVANEEMPTVGFTPDGRFPVIYAEKGIAVVELSTSLGQQSGPIRLVAMQGGHRSNMVPDRAEAYLEGPADQLEMIGEVLVSVPDVDSTIEYEKLIIRATGKSAHASIPHTGRSAVKTLIQGLMQIEGLNEIRPALATIYHWAADITGEYLGIAGSEEITGALTSSLGVLKFDGDSIAVTFSVRVPVTWQETELRQKIERTANGFGYQIASFNYDPPLYVPIDSPLVTTLLEVYRNETGDLSQPVTMGGGTYARVLKHGVAFGPNFPGFPDNAHQADEYWTVDDLIKATRIYAKALARLAV